MIYLREANNIEDCVLSMAWHSSPLIFNSFHTIREPLTWEEHYKWWYSTTSTWKKFMVVKVDNCVSRDIGLVRISGLEDFSPQVSLTIGECSLWGQHIGREVLGLTMDWLRTQGKHHVHTTIEKTNIRALRLFEQMGFKIYGEARKGEVWVQREI